MKILLFSSDILYFYHLFSRYEMFVFLFDPQRLQKLNVAFPQRTCSIQPQSTLFMNCQLYGCTQQLSGKAVNKVFQLHVKVNSPCLTRLSSFKYAFLTTFMYKSFISIPTLFECKVVSSTHSTAKVTYSQIDLSIQFSAQ